MSRPSRTPRTNAEAAVLALGDAVCGPGGTVTTLDRSPVRYLYHHACTAILPSLTGAQLPPGSPRWMREQTHGCWCSSWRMTARGLRVRRGGRWAVPKPGEVKSRVMERWMFEEQYKGGAIEVSAKGAAER